MKKDRRNKKEVVEKTEKEIEKIQVDFSFYKLPIIIAATVTVVFYILVFIFVR